MAGAGRACAGAGAAAGVVLTFVQLYLNSCAASAHQWIAKLLAVSGRTWPSRAQDLPVVVSLSSLSSLFVTPVGAGICLAVCA